MNEKRKNFFKKLQYSSPSQEENKNISNYIEDYKKTLFYTMDTYLSANAVENREYLCYLTAAIFLTYKKYYPQLSIYLPFRTKSDISFIQNIKKEFKKFSEKTKSENQDSLKNEKENIDPNIFNPEGILKDISGIKIVLDNINFSLPPNRKLISESTSLEQRQNLDILRKPEFKELISIANNNLDYLDEIEDFINSSETIPIKKFYKYKVELLKRISEATPEAFTHERSTRPYSYHELYNDEDENLKTFLKEDSFPTSISESEKQTFLELIDALRSRVYDNLHFKLLDNTLPTIFEEPIIKNGLKVSIKETKTSEKPNGFKAIYYTLITPFGLIELQSQSNKAYYASTKGSAFHSGLKGKSVDFEDFFELVDPNDKHPKEYYMDLLDSYSADCLIGDESLPYFENNTQKEEFMKTPQGKNYEESQKIKELQTHIKLKDNISLSNSENNNLNKKNKEPNINETLLTMALAYSSYMNVCSSGHTSTTTASIHHKKIVGEFAEVLRKRDLNTCLREILIKRIRHIVEGKIKLNNENLQDRIKKHDEVEIQLPKDIAMKNIIRYTSELPLKLVQNSKSVSSNDNTENFKENEK